MDNNENIVSDEEIIENQDVIETQEVADPPPDDGSEDRARLSGWTPKEEFKGDPERWVEAGDWNERTDNIMPILKATNRKLEEGAAASNIKIRELQSAVAESREVTERMLKVQSKISEQAYNKAKSDLQKQQKKAAENEDWDAYEAAETAQENLEKPEIPEIPKPQADTPQPDNAAGKEAFALFMKNNDWFEKKTDEAEIMTGVAYHLANKYQKEGLIDPVEQIRAVEADIKKKFPGYFKNGRRDIQSVDDSGGGVQKKSSNEFSKLPADAKEQYRIIKSDLPEYTEKEFLEAYNE